MKNTTLRLLGNPHSAEEDHTIARASLYRSLERFPHVLEGLV